MRKNKNIRHIDLNTIQNPTFLKDLSYKELDVLSSDIRELLIESASKNGGHLSSNLGVVEATIALCRVFDFTKDKIIFDVGHQCYTYKLLTGRSIRNIRQENGLSGFQKISESPYDHFEAGHSSTSISVGAGLALARDLDKANYNVISFIGDASIANGLAMEGLNFVAESKSPQIIILNDNDMAISSSKGAISKMFRKFSTSTFYTKSKSTFKKFFSKTKFGRKIYSFFTEIKNFIKRHLIQTTIFDTFGFSIIGPVDGHNIKALEKAFTRSKKLNKTVIVHIKTIKGKGYKPAEEDKIGLWHGVNKFDIKTGEILTSGLTWSGAYGKSLYQFMDKNPKSILICPATELGSELNDIFTNFSNRVFDVGISEEHAVTMAGGFAVNGKYPIISMYSTFLQRAYDQISHDLARMNLSAIFLIDRAGLVGLDGETHQGIYDDAFIRTIPNTNICMASNPSQIPSLLNEAKNHGGLVFIRYPREKVEEGINYPKEHISFGKWLKYGNNTQKAVIAVGPEVENLKKYVSEHKISVTIINAIYQRPIDTDMLDSLFNFKELIIYDAYATEVGFARDVVSYLGLKNFKGKIIVRTIKNEFVKQNTIQTQKQNYELTIEDIIKII